MNPGIRPVGDWDGGSPSRTTILNIQTELKSRHKSNWDFVAKLENGGLQKLSIETD